MSKSHVEEILAHHIYAMALPLPEREYRFARDIAGHGPGIRARLKAAGLKDWRFDFVWPALKLAAEVEGGTWSGGRHVRGAGFEGDCYKYNEAALVGWIVLRFTTGMVKSGVAVEMIERALERLEIG